MCVLYVSFGSKVRPRTFGCVAMRSAVLSDVTSAETVVHKRTRSTNIDMKNNTGSSLSSECLHNIDLEKLGTKKSKPSILFQT